MQHFESFFSHLGYFFKDLDLFEQALKHRSYSSTHNNERLEFLGDAVLGFVISETLFHQHQKAPEGHLSRLRSSLVNTETLAFIAKKLMLPDYVLLGSGERKTGGKERSSILADTLEALIGAIYLDSDMQTCQACVGDWYKKFIANMENLTAKKDPKTRLQEWAQAKKYPLPIYSMTSQGAAHQQTFHVQCTIAGLDYVSTGESTSRRRAEQLAAEDFLKLIENKS